jgi:hypothetical protein
MTKKNILIKYIDVKIEKKDPFVYKLYQVINQNYRSIPSY